LNKASIILVFISREALLVKVMATIPLNLFGDLFSRRMDKYCNTSWYVLPLPAEALKTNNGYFSRLIDDSII
jgi:hypothetical protein